MAPPLPPPGVPGRDGFRAVPDGPVADEPAARHVPRDPDAAQRTAVAAHVGREAAVEDLDREGVVLGEHAYRSASDVRPAALAAGPDERGAHDAQPPAAREDGAAATAIEVVAGRVTVREAEVLDHEPRRGLVLAMRARGDLGRVAGVHVQDAPLAPAAQRDQPTPIEDDLAP